MKKVLLCLFIILTMFITSCSFSPKGAGVESVEHNDGINKQILDSVKILDDKVLDGIRNNDLDKILEISGEEFKSNSSNFKNILVKTEEALKGQSLEYKDRYYCKVNKIGKYNAIITDSNDDSFNITVEAVNKDIFVSMIKTTSNKDDFLLTLIYIKENNEWKLYSVSAGNYSYGGMSAINLYEKAKSLEAQGYKVAANIYMGLCGKILRPVPFIQYKKETEMIDYGKKLQQSISNEYAFPDKLKNNNNIQLYGFRVEYTRNDGIIPVIRYVTSTGLDKKEELKKEANDMDKEVTDKYKGLKENFKYVLYEAYSEPPIDPKKTYNDFRTGVEQK
ncbi:hypothetical protein B0P06_004512 [Clostridium saccharoperbutylacetonicum]|uniref:Lipoprotein n=1 Tax=Clostridium saccharoperbutylacetonicum N1-4(HMT) TaxID=931276 RepID=M1N100_9CLOT|nr:hypothetical protein [Clostridium saccharoperbutylacetonicum]AGF57197.1 hypothetical protein Cspa_c34360 [Clostridium saccharoperbutylacetonicum N1-4(HMT)]NRT62043.1 hypothetical protein [Clostridium saccharoperbutylacetonicum]NSB25372.1 hypothetical protein [Clostridium saccharoperbutylacetonicum]NSB44741.1 hypothetical protein [Clostridium saccharoperbutylacetonicum]